MSRADTCMPLNVGDYLDSAMRPTAAEVGVHVLLRMHEHQHGALPDDDAALARIVRADRAAWEQGLGAIVRSFCAASTDGDGLRLQPIAPTQPERGMA